MAETPQVGKGSSSNQLNATVPHAPVEEGEGNEERGEMDVSDASVYCQAQHSQYSYGVW